uniref:CX domain-containing protein n=1 Tax=Syphacia muris TaxID=451379 RepID=A0A0N5AG73_9BILA
NQPQVYPQQPSYNQGGYHQQPNPGVIHQQQPNIGYNHGGYQQPNYHINNPNTGYFHFFSIHTGTGLGSPRSGQWKTALAAGAAGAIGGVLAWEAGKAIIRSATEPAHINGRDYYFTNDDNKYQKKAGEIMCSMDFQESIKQTQTTTTAAPDGNTNDTTTSTTPSPDQLLSSMQFKDGSRPKKIVWTCRAGTEVCCGSDCCPAPSVQQQPTSQNGVSNNVSGDNVSLKNVLLM